MEAQHIGAAAREAHRRQRLHELAAQIEEGQRTVVAIRDELAALARRSQALSAEIDGTPRDGAVRQAHAALAASRTLLHRLRAALIDAEREGREARDLDFVMTSEREWGCYATLPGVAIYQLVNRPEIWAVGMTRWVWNGRQRVRTAVLSAEPRPPSPPANAPQLSLVGADLHVRAEEDERESE